MNENNTISEDETFDSLVFNGIDAASGGYLLPEMTPAQVSAMAQGQTIEPENINELKNRAEQGPHYGFEGDARNLAESGWGVIFAHKAEPALMEALDPLLKHRQEQAGERFKVYQGADGYRPGESKAAFLERHGMGPGPANPDRVPYYLLIVGDPSTIPYRFQYQLDVQYAVGRLAFDSIEDYARYAQSVVEAERDLKLPPRATFFGVSNTDDRATSMSAEHLVQPLAEKLRASLPAWKAEAGTMVPEWGVQTLLKDQATKANLSSLLEGGQAPALFFSASHGIGFPNGDPRQLPHQGALLCQDWPGPQNWREAIRQDFYFAGEDLSSDANLLGTIAFFFACYGAGTPQRDEFAQQLGRESRAIAPHDFIAGLPKRMLSLPKGGALAVVGHVERAWGASFFWGKAGPQLQVFEDSFERLMKGGYPIGYAVELFNNRYAELSSELTSELNEINNYGKEPNDMELARMWTANNDARNYVVLGDPAVRLFVGEGKNGDSQRPVIEEITSRTYGEAISAVPIEGETESEPEAAPEPIAGISPVSPTYGGATRAVPTQGETEGEPEAAPEPIAGITPVSPDYGLMDSFKQTQANLSETLQGFVGRLGEFLGKALDEATSLEVSTYVSEDMSEVKFEGGRFTGAQLRAMTRIEIDGDTLICVPETDGEVDMALWKVHTDMVQQAQASRTELLKTVVSAATGLVDLLKP